jgi:uncharacterized membrane protein YqiK
LDVAQIVHIPRNEAPKVIARFGNMMNLVTQVLEPTIGNYFRNAAQTSDVIDFLKKRSERQNEAKTAIANALKDYNVNSVDTLIGDIVPPEALMTTLTDRKIAEQQQITFGTQKLAEETRKELEQARAIANTQAKVVDSERKVAIAKFEADAAVNNASGVAQSRIINAEAEAKATIVTGNADGAKITAVGEAEAKVIQLKTNAVGQGNFALIEVGKALAASGLKLVPDIIAGSGTDGGNSGIVQVLMAGLLRDMATKRQTEAKTAVEEPKA